MRLAFWDRLAGASIGDGPASCDAHFKMELSSWKMKWESATARLLSRCRACGLSLGDSRCPLCERCRRIAQNAAAEHGSWLVASEPFPIRALFLWNDRDEAVSPVLRSLVLSAKTDPTWDHVEWICGQFLIRMGASEGRVEKLRFVNPPGRSGNWEADHSGKIAYRLAELTAQRHRLEMFKGLCGEVSAQKELRVEERLERRFKVLETVKQVCGDQEHEDQEHDGDEFQWIFVDDVVASGGTARAAWLALGRPRNFEVWAIAWKQRER